MSAPIPFCDLTLARRLELAEARANVAFVDARAALEPDVHACWERFGGAYAMFDGPGSPMTQTFGLGITGPVGAEDLEPIEAFFRSRAADINHEVSPLAGVEVFALLHQRGYTPIEASSVMFRPLEAGGGLAVAPNPRVRVRPLDPAEGGLFAVTSARGWSEMPDLQAFIGGISHVSIRKADGPCFVAEIDGAPIATGAMSMSEGVALMAGASTVPEGRRQGAQLALLDARLRAAAAAGCDLAMTCAQPGSPSQRNAERHGFRIAYTRVKWQLGR